jgi:hypothetical protein
MPRRVTARVRSEFSAPISRRQALAAGPLLGLATTASLATPIPRIRSYDFDRPGDTIHALVKIIGDVSGRTTYGWSQGEIFGLTPGALARPLLRYESCRIGRYIAGADGAFEYRYRGMIFYKDYDTGAFIDRFRNPYTEAIVPVRHFQTSIGRYVYTERGVAPNAAFKGETGKRFGEPFRLPWTIVGDDIWVTLDERVRYRRPSDGEYRVDNAILRYAAKNRALEDARLTSVPCTSSWQTQLNWFGWLGMDAREGMIMQGGHGRKFETLEELPPALRKFAELKFPGSTSSPIE